MTIAPLAGWLVTLYGWRQTMTGIGIGTWVVLLPFVYFIRAVPTPAATPGKPASDGGAMSAKDALRLARFHRAGRRLLCLLRRALGADLPHGELRHRLRTAHGGGRHHLQHGRRRRPGRAIAVRRARGQVRRQAGAGGGPAGAGVRRRVVPGGQPARRLLCRGHRVRRGLWRHHAAVCRAGARRFRPAHPGHRAGRGHAARAWAWRWARSSAAGCSIASAATPGCTSAR